MGRHHKVEPVLQRRRLHHRAHPLHAFFCQRCGRPFTVDGVCSLCTACTIGSAEAGWFGPCPHASGQ